MPDIKWDNPLPRNIAVMYPQLEGLLRQATEFKATDAEAYMKSNAPWSDQTGNARNGLNAQPYSEGAHFGIRLRHGVPYGIYLETRFSGRYAILQPTLEVKGPEFMRLLNKILARVRGIG